MGRLTALAFSALAFAPAPLVCQAHGAAADFSIAGPSFVAIRVSDVDQASMWYQQALGLTEVNRIDTRNGRVAIRVLTSHGFNLELIEERGVEAPPDRHEGLFKAGFYVRDLAALHRRLEGLGVDQDDQTFVDQALNAKTFVFRDLEGNRIQVFERCDGGC